MFTRSRSVSRTENAQNVPEQQSYTGKESQRRGYMLFGIKPVKDIRRFVQNRGSCEGDHYEREHGSQRKAKDRTRHDESQCGKSADRENRK